MKKAFLIPTLILSCVGATMCSQKDDAPEEAAAAKPASARPPAPPAATPAGKAPADTQRPAASLLAFAAGAHPFYVLKAADAGHVPAGTFLGKDAFLRAGKPAGKVLLVVLVPASAKGARIALEAAGKAAPVEAPRLIYRMPNSPAHTFVLVDAQAPGRLTVAAPDGSQGSLDLSAIATLPHHWGKEESGALDYDDLPKDLYGKMPG